MRRAERRIQPLTYPPIRRGIPARFPAAPALAALLAACAATGPGDDSACLAGPSARIATGAGPEDLVVVPFTDNPPGRHLLIVRVQGGLQAATLGPAGAFPTAAEEAAPTFDSLGLSFLPGLGKDPSELFAIDRGAPGVRRFAVKGEGLTPVWSGTADPAVLPSPNDLLAVRGKPGRGDLYISNPDLLGIRSRLGAWPSVVLWREGKPPRPVVRDLGFANGLAANEAGDRVLVADFRARRLVAYRRDGATGDLERLCHVPIDGLPDNLSVDIDDPDRVLVAAHGSFWRSAFHLIVSSGTDAPSRVYEVRFADITAPSGGPGSACTLARAPWLLWSDDGASVAAGSTAVQVGDTLLVGQVRRPGVVAVTCPRPS